jgi:hypothetical protein
MPMWGGRFRLPSSAIINFFSSPDTRGCTPRASATGRAGTLMESDLASALQLVDGQTAEQLWIKVSGLLGHYTA